MNKIDSLPSVSEMMKNAGVMTDKSFGQHFLFDLNITDKIARAIPDLEKMNVIEVGPGAGSLTRSLVRCGAASVLSVEMDKRMQPVLDAVIDAADGRLNLHFGDALKLNRDWYLNIPAPRAIASNLPYNVGTELLIGWLHNMDLFSSLTLMFQKEVAQRVVAKVGDKHYGRLSVLVSMVCDAKVIFPVSRAAFNPPPKVENAVVQLVPHGKYSAELVQKVELISAKLFANRRKMIRGAMPGFDWAAVGLVGTERAEELSISDFIKIVEVVS